MSGSAKFKITGNAGESPSTDKGYDADAGDTLTLELEDSTDISKAEFFFVKKSVAARSLSYPFTPSDGVLSGSTEVQGGCTLDIDPTLPDAGVALWIRCEVNNGNDANGNPKDDYRFDRMVVVRANGIRPPIAGEAYEYDPDDGWVPEIETQGALVGAATSSSLGSRVTALEDADVAQDAAVASLEARVTSLEASSSEPLTIPIVLDVNASIDASGTNPFEPLFVAFAASGHVNGVSKRYLVRAYSRPSVLFGDQANQTGPAYDPRYDYEFVCTYTQGRVATVSRTIVLPETKAPQLLWAHVPSANPDVLQLGFDEPVYVGTLGDLTFSVTGGGAITASSVRQGQGTSNLEINLSRDITTADTVVAVFGAAFVADLFSNALPAQSQDVFWYTEPGELAGNVLYRDASEYPYDDAGSEWASPASPNDDAYLVQQVTSGNRPEGIAGYAGEDAIQFTPANSDYFATTDVWRDIASVSEDNCWVVFRPRSITTNSGNIYENEGVVGAQNYWGIALKTGGGDDTWTATFYNFDTWWDESNTVPVQVMAPTLLRSRHVGGNIYLRRDVAAEVAGVASGNTGAGGGDPFVIGSRKTDAGFGDLDIMAVILTNTDQSAQFKEGIDNYLMRQPWGSFLRPQVMMPTLWYATVGIAFTICWEQVFLSQLMDPTDSALSQYTFTVSGIPGSPTVDTTGLSWTPGSGHTGTHAFTVEVKLGGRIVATAFSSVTVAAASDTGTVRVCCIGDSWTDGDIFGQQIHADLLAAGLTVTMLGTRGGRVTTVVAATDVFTSTSHPYANGDAVDLRMALGGGVVLPTAAGGDLAEGVTYYVRDVSGSTFKLARTIGGAAIDVTSTGTGIWYVRRLTDEPNEGRGGWSLSDFLGTADAQQPYIGGADDASPLVDPNGVDGLSFSPAYYVSTHLGGVAPTHWIIQAGVNDTATGSPDTDPDDPVAHRALVEQRVYEASVIVAAIHAYDPAAYVAVVVPGAANVLQSAAYDAGAGGGVIWRQGWRLVQHQLAKRFAETFHVPADKTAALPAQCINTDQFDAIDFFHPQVAEYVKLGHQGSSYVRSTV